MFPRHKKPSIWQRLRWKLSPIYWEARCFFPNLKRLFQWLPVVWKDRDFDYNFYLTLMQYKLKRMREHIVEHDIVLATPRIARQIKFCEDTIARLQTDEYIEAEDKAHEEKWGEQIWDSLPTENERSRTLDIYRVKAREQGLEDQERDEQRVLYKLAKTRREKDLDRLFRVQRKYLEGWWD